MHKDYLNSLIYKNDLNSTIDNDNFNSPMNKDNFNSPIYMNDLNFPDYKDNFDPPSYKGYWDNNVKPRQLPTREFNPNPNLPIYSCDLGTEKSQRHKTHRHPPPSRTPSQRQVEPQESVKRLYTTRHGHRHDCHATWLCHQRLHHTSTHTFATRHAT